MAGHSGSTFGKRQKERARQEKQREKLEKKRQRKLDKANGVYRGNDDIDATGLSIEAEPAGEDLEEVSADRASSAE